MSDHSIEVRDPDQEHQPKQKGFYSFMKSLRKDTLVMKHPLKIIENSMLTQKDEADLTGHEQKRTLAMVYISCNV